MFDTLSRRTLSGILFHVVKHLDGHLDGLEYLDGQHAPHPPVRHPGIREAVRGSCSALISQIHVNSASNEEGVVEGKIHSTQHLSDGHMTEQLLDLAVRGHNASRSSARNSVRVSKESPSGCSTSSSSE